MAKYDRKQLMHRVEIALGELHLSSWTMADKKRLAYVQQGLIALDEEQALVKSGIEDLLEEYQKTEHTTSPGRAISARGNAVSNLILGLQKLVKEELPRVSYPDRKLLEPPRVQKNVKDKKPVGGRR